MSVGSPGGALPSGAAAGNGLRRPRHEQCTSRAALLCVGGLLGARVALSILPQQIGLQYTKLVNAGFISLLHVVIVPMLGALLRHRTGTHGWGSTVLCVANMYRLSVGGDFTVQLGDLYQLAELLVCQLGGGKHCGGARPGQTRRSERSWRDQRDAVNVRSTASPSGVSSTCDPLSDESTMRTRPASASEATSGLAARAPAGACSNNSSVAISWWLNSRRNNGLRGDGVSMVSAFMHWVFARFLPCWPPATGRPPGGDVK
ncbi:hypothetical protein IHE30_04475 [Mycetohabitans sp. B46]